MSRVKWDEQDCAEMPLLASEKIARLCKENEALQQSRNELLNSLIYIRKRITDGTLGLPDGTVQGTIQKAQDLKDT